MSGAHLHLLVNHVPILGTALASLLLLIALHSRDRQAWAHCSLLVLAISVAGGVAAFFSGDPALNAVDGMPRTSGHALQQHHILAVVAGSLAVTPRACVDFGAPSPARGTRRSPRSVSTATAP